MSQSVCPSGAPTNNGNVADLLGLSTQMEVSIYLTSIYLLIIYFSRWPTLFCPLIF